MRGKGVPCSARRLGRGITPARAGKSVCGEKFIFVTTQISALRITPACAGKSLSISFSVAFFRDHPRVCGEKSTQESFTEGSEGSPPRVRGKGPGFRVKGFPCGITPACAGKRPGFLRFAVRPQDHPRVCGEKHLHPATVTAALGSPPRVRGKARICRFSGARRRITPACAGKRAFVIPADRA